MAESTYIHSEYLQDRLRNKKAEHLSNGLQRSGSGPTRRRTTGRDDAIFNIEEPLDASGRKNSSGAAKYMQPSPIGPSSWRFEESQKTHSRRSSTLSGGNTNGGTRAMGARELEDHLDKLSKANFDLKMEVFHRREKIEELEKKLTTVPQLEEDNAALLEMNEELLKELEKRDRAVDEAVVLICDLEERLQSLNSQLTRPRRVQASREGSSLTASESEQSARGRTGPVQRGSSKKTRDVDGNWTAISPEVSARMAQLALPSDPEQPAGRVPSFINDKAPVTDALRSLFVDGDRPIRPIPSHATLLSQPEDEDEDAQASYMDSPRLSMLSETDLKSIYGRDTPVVQLGAAHQNTALNEEGLDPHTDDSLSREGKLARTNMWVTDAAVSPPRPQKQTRSRNADAGQFQSLGGVLHQGTGREGAESPMKLKRKQAAPRRSGLDNSTPPIPVHPVFGQTVFPPTPDTMVTRPSNNSTTSIIQEKSLQDGIAYPSKGYAPAPPSQSQPKLASPQAQSYYVKRSSLLPREVDPYEESAVLDEPSTSHSNGDFGASLFRRTNSDASADFDMPRRYPPQTSSSGSDIPPLDSLLGTSPFNSPSPPRLSNGGRRSSMHFQNPTAFQPRPVESLSRLNSEPVNGRLLRMASVDATHLRAPGVRGSNFTQTQTPDRVATIQSQQLQNSTPPSVYHTPQQEKSESQATAMSPPSTKGSGGSGLSRRAASLKQRVNRFTRRHSASTNAADSMQPQGSNSQVRLLEPKSPTSSAMATSGDTSTHDTPTASGQPRRSSSITRRLQRFRRGSNSSHGEAPSSYPFNYKQQGDDDSMADARSSRASLFLQAANAAAPFLCFDTNALKSADPVVTTLEKTLPSMPPHRSNSNRYPAAFIQPQIEKPPQSAGAKSTSSDDRSISRSFHSAHSVDSSQGVSAPPPTKPLNSASGSVAVSRAQSIKGSISSRRGSGAGMSTGVPISSAAAASKASAALRARSGSRTRTAGSTQP